jgi:type II secretory pathway pseudopilin PulG
MKARSQVQTFETGLTLIETMVAAVVLLIGVVAMMGMFGVAVSQNQGQGRLAVQTATYCQNKLQDLSSLKFTDSTTDTTVWPPAGSGGTGLCGALAAGSVCGSIDPGAPGAGFIDYLDANGNRVGTEAAARFIRQWQITSDATGTLKTITVYTRAVAPSPPAPPTVTLVAVKTNRGT